MADLAALLRAKLQSSGLSAAHGKALRLKTLTGKQVRALSGAFHERGAVQLPYFDFTGKPTKFYRLRYLEDPVGFAAQLAKPPRYVQPPDTLNEVYLPPMLDWEVLRDDPAQPLWITEGEFKAAAACAHDLPCMGLGGVDVWRSQKRGLALLPQLDAINWDARTVYVVFDSDAADNMNVLRARLQLCRALTERGATPYICSLPPHKGHKQGLDDWLLHNAPADLLPLCKPYSSATALWELNSEVVLVRDPPLVIQRNNGTRMSTGTFKDHTYANRVLVEEIVFKESTRLKETPAAKRWLAWPHRAEVDKLIYAPQYAPGVVRNSPSAWNTWPGWGCAPRAGSVKPWTALLDYLLSGAQPDHRRWLEQWLAYPLQHPGTKLYSAVAVWGATQGTGKTLLGHSLLPIYGANASEINDSHLRSAFNEWAEHKQFVMGEEITGSDHRAEADRLKGMITQRTLRINTKFVPSYAIVDCINYYFTSNHPDAFFLEDTDRRFFVHEAPDKPLPMAFYKDYDRWLRSADGPPALFHHLRTLDLTGFDPQGAAPTTASKQQMVYDNKSDVGAWVLLLREDPRAALLPLGDKVAEQAQLLTTTQLLRAYDPEHKGRVTANGLGRELKRAGFKQINHGIPVRVGEAQQRLYAVRNAAHWHGLGIAKLNAQAAQHWDEVFTRRKKS